MADLPTYDTLKEFLATKMQSRNADDLPYLTLNTLLDACRDIIESGYDDSAIAAMEEILR